MEEVRRGQIRWADLGEPNASGPGLRRPVLVVQADAFNRSAIRTVLVVALTSNTRLAAAPGNVLLPARATRLKQDSVANVSQVVTLDREQLSGLVGKLSPRHMAEVDEGLRLVLNLD